MDPETVESDFRYEPGQEQLASGRLESTVSDHEPANSMVTSPPPVEAISPPLIYRTSSMPGGMEETAHSSSPVQLRLATSRSRKKAQYIRNSVAVTNSDYLTQWRPQMMKLLQLQSPTGSAGSIRTVPSLGTISEHELSETFQPTLSPLVSRREQQQADPNMFRYTPTPILDPARQTIPRPPSRPTTPVPPSSSVLSSRATTPMLTPSGITESHHPFQVHRESSQAIRLSANAENLFLPVFINPESGVVYMFEDGYYVPLAPQQVQPTAEDSAKATVTQPPAPDRRTQDVPGRQGRTEEQAQRYSRLFQEIPDYLRFVQLLMILFLLCCDIAVLLVFGIPALLCSLKVRKANRTGRVHDAETYSEYTLCFTIGGIIFHIALVLIVITTFLLLHFVGRVFD